MSKIIVNGEDVIKTIGQDSERALEAHGYDPETDEYEVVRSIEERLRDVENGVGSDGQGQRGIAQRIDDLEDRVSELEDSHS